MKKTFSAGFIGFIFLSVGLLFTSCTELNLFKSRAVGKPELAPEAPEAALSSKTPEVIPVMIKEILPSSSDYYFWSSLLGSPQKKQLNWKDAVNLSPRQLFFVKDGFSLDGKKYSGSLVIEKGEKGSFRLINEINLEDYLLGVIPAEMPPSWPIEALKAQAVVARTYALYDLSETGGYLESSVLDQVYQGSRVSKPVTDLAVRQTQGETLAFKGKIFPAYFHAASGGRTTTIPNVWPKKKDFPVLESIQDDFSANSPHQNWVTELSPSEIAEAFKKGGYNFGTISSLQILKRDPTGRVISIQVSGTRATKVFDGNEFRLILGWKNLKSTWFSLSSGGGKYLFTGRGFGHGVGLSQWGAKAMAEKGYSYKQILKFYFPKADLK